MFPSLPADTAAPTPGTDGDGVWRRPASRGAPPGGANSRAPDDPAAPLDTAAAARRMMDPSAGPESEAPAIAGDDAPEAASFATIFALQQQPLPPAGQPRPVPQADAGRAAPLVPTSSLATTAVPDANSPEDPKKDADADDSVVFSPALLSGVSLAAVPPVLFTPSFAPALPVRVAATSPEPTRLANVPSLAAVSAPAAPHTISGADAEKTVPVAPTAPSLPPAPTRGGGPLSFVVPAPALGAPEMSTAADPIPVSQALAPKTPAALPTPLAFTGGDDKDAGMDNRALSATLPSPLAPQGLESSVPPQREATQGARAPFSAPPPRAAGTRTSFADARFAAEQTDPAAPLAPVTAAASSTTFGVVRAPQTDGHVVAARQRVFSTAASDEASFAAPLARASEKPEPRRAGADVFEPAAGGNAEAVARVALPSVPNEAKPALAGRHEAAPTFPPPLGRDLPLGEVPVDALPAAAPPLDSRKEAPTPGDARLFTAAEESAALSAERPNEAASSPPPAWPPLPETVAAARSRERAEERHAGTLPSAATRNNVQLPGGGHAAATVPGSGGDANDDGTPDMSGALVEAAVVPNDVPAPPVAASSAPATPLTTTGNVERRSEAVVAPVRAYLSDAATVALPGRHRVTLILTPDTLGEVRVRIETAPGGVVRAALIATTPEAQSALQKAGDSLRRTLEERGLRVRELSVHLDPTIAAAAFVEPGGAASEMGQQPRPQQQFAGSGNGANDAASFFAGSGGQPGGRQGAFAQPNAFTPISPYRNNPTADASDAQRAATLLAAAQRHGTASVNLLA